MYSQKYLKSCAEKFALKILKLKKIKNFLQNPLNIWLLITLLIIILQKIV